MLLIYIYIYIYVYTHTYLCEDLLLHAARVQGVPDLQGEDRLDAVLGPHLRMHAASASRRVLLRFLISEGFTQAEF